MAKILYKSVDISVDLYEKKRKWKHVDIAYETDYGITKDEICKLWEQYCPGISKESREVWYDELYVSIMELPLCGKTIKRVYIQTCFTGDYLAETKEFRKAFEKYIMERPE